MQPITTTAPGGAEAVGGAPAGGAAGARGTTDAGGAAGSGIATEFRPDVAGLRAVAVLLVVLHHAGVSVLSGGYVGVDVFFVISGFVITMTLGGELGRRGTVSITGFYARRATRLLPASTLVIAATLAASWLWLPPVRTAEIAADALASTLYAINYRLALQGTDYFATDAPSPLQHFWSLAVEEQFYFVWPLLLLAASLGWLRRRRAPRGPRVGSVVAVLATLAVASFGLGVWLTGRSAPWAYFAAPARAWELAIGALVAVGATALARVPRRLAATATWAGLAAVVASAVAFDDATAFPGYAALLPVAGTALIIAGGCAAPRIGTQALLGTGAFQWIGKLSYSWYLWHWPVFVIAPGLLGDLPGPWQRSALAAGSLGLAAATYALVENPIRTRGSLRLRPWKGLTLGAALSAAAAVVAVLAAQLIPAPVGGGAAEDLAAGVSAPAEDAERRLRQAISAAVYTEAVPANLTPTLTAAPKDLPILYKDGCDPRLTEIDVASPCVYGDTAAQTTIALYGDSHAGHWFPAVDAMAKRRHWRLAVVTKSVCSAASTLIYLPRLKRPFHECDQWRERSLARIAALRPAMVLVSSRGDGGKPIAQGDPDQIWTDGWLASLRRLKADGARPVLISDTPLPKLNAPECVSAHLTDVYRCNTAVKDAILKPRRRQLVEAAATREGVPVVDPTAWFCTAATCPDIVGNVLVYKDASHMTTTYSTLLSPLLERRVAPL